MRRLRIPGDKSLSHRALMLASLADGSSRVSGLLAGEDPQSTAQAFRELGLDLPELPLDGGPVHIEGRGLRALRSPSSPLDLGNSGTTARLLLGILAGQPDLTADLTGDASLCSRPMRRVTAPLGLMGARFEELGEPDRLPLRVHGGTLRYLDYPSPVASAQVKSAVLLAGLVGGVPVQITEPRRSRDHTERMLTAMGASVISHAVPEGWRVELRDPPRELRPLDFAVPGDISSAAFLLGLALLGGAQDGLLLEDVGINPTRTGLLPVLERMGGRVRVGDVLEAVEPRGTLTVSPSRLQSTDVGAAEIPALVDEIPLMAVLAARADGTTRIRGAEELRVKESDRLTALADNLSGLGVEVREYPDGLDITGTDRPLEGTVFTAHDHRIAMAFGILAHQPENDIRIQDPEIADVSFPGFWTLLEEITGQEVGG